MRKSEKLRFRRILLISFIVVPFICTAIYTAYLKSQRETSYKAAIELFESGTYNEARTAYNQLGSYKDSIEYYKKSIQYTKYSEAEKLFEDGNYLEAAEAFRLLGSFEESETKCTESLYAYAISLFNSEDYEEAFAIFQELKGYEKSDLYVADITLLLQKKMQERIFNEARRLFDNDEYSSALAELSKIEDYPGSSKLKQECTDRLSRLKLSHTFSAGIHGTVAIKQGGELAYIGGEMATQVEPLIGQDIVSIACFGVVTIGLTRDGHVVTTDLSDTDVYVNVSDWKDIIAIDAGRAHVVGLTNDGEVKCSGHNGDKQCNVKDWEDDCIVAIATGWRHTVGLTSEKTVKITGHVGNKQRRDVELWTDIVAIAAGGGSIDSEGNGHTVGLKSNGHVVAAGDNKFGQCDVYGEDWENIIAIAAGDWHTVGLKSDGTVVATGSLDPNKPSAACDVDDWKNIVAIDASTGYTLGLTADGVLKATGFNKESQRPESDVWKDIIVSNEWETVKKQRQND